MRKRLAELYEEKTNERSGWLVIKDHHRYSDYKTKKSHEWQRDFADWLSETINHELTPRKNDD